MVGVTALVVGLPVIVATINVLGLDWTPSSDDGAIAVRAFDVLSAHPPLLGQYSQSSALVSVPVYSVGPLLYYLLALPARIGPAALPVTMALVNLASIVVIVNIARRRGGTGLMLLTALVLVLTLRSLPPEVSFEVWNTWAGMLPFAALLFVAWSVSCGESRLLPLLVLLGSYVVQCDLAYAAPVLLTCGGAAIWLWLGRRADRRSPVDRPRGTRRFVLAAAIVFGLAWAPAVVDQLTRSPGNLDQVVRLATSGYPPVGIRAALRLLARVAGMPPLWLQAPAGPFTWVLRLVRDPSAGTTLSALLVLGGLVAVAVAGLRRGRRDLAAASTLALAVLLSVAVAARSMPSGDLGVAVSAYVLTWMELASMFAHLVLLWSLWALRPPALRHLRPPPRAALALPGVTLAVAAALVAARRIDVGLVQPPRVGSYQAIAVLTARVVSQLPRTRPVLLDAESLGLSGLTFESALAYVLRRRGTPFAVPPAAATALGLQYCPGSIAYPAVLIISQGRGPSGPGTRLLAQGARTTFTLASGATAAHARYEELARETQDPTVRSRCPRTG